jgi:uroporphyrinogen decarboxylase
MEPTARELFNRIMHYEPVDRMPVLHWSGWPETLERWHNEGMPKGVNECEFFDAAEIGYGVGIDNGLFPRFDEQLLEESGDAKVIRQSDGVIAKHWKNKSCIPHYIDFTLKGEQGWDEYKKRLQPDPARIPADLDERIERALASGAPISIGTGSMVGWIRDWMGVENLAYLAYDNRELLAEMVMTIADLVVWSLEQVLPKVTPDCGWGWEDICFRTGPLVSPHIFAEVAVPGYRKISDTLLEHGVDLHVIDCDGMIDALIPHWLDGGVNVMFPVEIGAWNADPAAMRKRYGKTLRIIGGINKLQLAKGRAAIDAEIERRIPLMRDGGYVPLPDHLIIPDTPLSDYRYYLDRIRALRL